MNNSTYPIRIKGIPIILCLFLALIWGNTSAQTVPVTNPNGGFAVDGDLESNTPLINIGDWVNAAGGTGGFILDNSGVPVNPVITGLVRDVYNTNADNSFTGGSKFNDDPNTWVWANSSATGKGDIHNAMYHIVKDVSGDEWVISGSDRRSTTGTSYIDFSFLQNTLTTNGSFGFNSAGPDGGRTINDILLTVEYGSGGSVATVFFYLWQNTGGSNYEYVLQGSTTSNAFAQSNAVTVPVPFGSFGTNTYTERQFVESAVNLTSIFGALPDPCIGVSIKTLMIKTKNSTAINAALNDFVEPIQVSFSFGTADISYAGSPVCEDGGPLVVTQTGVSGGSYTSAPAGLDIDGSTGEINVQNSNPGTYTVTYTYTTNSCVKTATTMVTIVANPSPPVSGGDQTECEEDPIQTLTATATVPVGQNVVWYDAPTGGNVVANPILNTVGSITYYAEAMLIGGSGCTSTSRTAVTLSIIAAPAAPISGGDQSECEEDPIQTLTATATVPAGHTIVWYDAPTGGNVVANPILNTVGTITYYAESVVTVGGCSSLSRTAVTLTITEAPAAPVSGGDQSECEEDPIQTLTATATVPLGHTIVWYDAPTGGNVVANPILNTVGTVTYYAESVVTIGGCSSLTRTAVTLTIIAAPAAPVSGGDQSECEEDPIQTLTATATVPAGHTIVWYDAPTGGNVVANPILNTVGTVTYYAESVVTIGGCSSLTRTAVTLTIIAAPAAPVSGGDQSECEEDPIQTLTATATVPAGHTIVWYDAPTGGNVVANPILNTVGTVTYYAESVVTVGGCSSLTRTAVTLTIIAAPAAPVSGGDQSECEEDPIQTLTATATVPAGHTIVWYDAPTGGNVVANPILNTVGTVTYYAESVVTVGGCSSLTRTAVTLTIIAAPAAPVSGGDQSECEEDPIQTLTATATVPAGHTIVWYDAPTGGNVVANPILNTVGTVTYYAESVVTVGGCSSLSRTAVTLTIIAAPAAPISGGDQSECEEDPIQTLTATATVPAGHTIVWYDAPTGGNVVANPILNTVGTVTYYAESVVTVGGCSSLTRTAITLTIIAAPAAPISGGDQSECEEDPIQTLTATATVPAGHTIVWYDAPTGGNVVANPILNTVGTVTYYAESVVTVGGCSSLTRTAVTLTIIAAPAAPISGGDQSECEEDPIQTLTATATVPAGHTIVWYDSPTGGNVVANPILNTVGTVTYYAESVVTVGGCSSLTRTAVTLTIIDAPAAPVSGGDQSECEEDPIQTLTATATVPAGHTIVWYDAPTGGNVVANPILNTVGTVTYYAESVVTVGGCSSLTRTAVTLTIIAAPAAPVSGGDQSECEEDPIQTLTATATVPAGHTIVWYDAPTGGNVVANPILNTVGTVTYYAESVVTVGGCSSLSRTAVTLTIIAAPAAPISGGDQSECEEDPIQTLTATATVPAGHTIVWYDAPTGGNVVANPILNTVGTVTYYAESVVTVGGCSSLTRTAVTLTIIAAPAAPISGGDQSECEEDPIQTLTATATVPAGHTIVWYDAPTGGNVVANPILNTVGTITYYAESVVTVGGCSSLTRTAVTLTIIAAPAAPVSGGDQSECEEDPIQTLTATATVPAGHTIVWYDAPTGGNVVANPILNTVGTVTYYAESVETVNGCSSLTRTAVTLTIIDAPAAPISGGDQNECEEDPIQTLTATATVPAGQTVVWYDAPTGGNVVANPILNTVGTVTYYAESVVTVGGCSSLTRTAVTLTIIAAPAAPISGGDQSECEEDPIQTLTATATVPAGHTIVWYDAPTGGNVVANPILNTVGTVTYYAESVETVNGCSSLTRTAVTLTILAAPGAPVSTGDITECEEDPIQTLDANDAVPPIMGINIVWYDAPTGGNVVANPTLNTVGTITYYAESVAATTNCTSLTRTAVTLTINMAADAPISTGDITECEEDPIQTLDANDAITPTTGQSVVWYDAPTGGNVVANPILNTVGTITYYAEGVIDQTDCVSLTRTAVTLTINQAADAPISTGDITECEEDPIQTLDANDAITPTTGQSIVWYDAPTGGNVVANPILNTVGTITYYAEGVVDQTDCTSLTRTVVTLTINEAADAPISTGDITECEEDPIQTLDANDAITPTTGQSVVWYDAPTGGNVVANPILNTVGTITYYAEGVIDQTDCVSLTRTAVTLTINQAADAPISTGDITECEEDPIQTLDANDAITPTTGQSIVWYDAPTGGNVVANPILNTVGTITYYAEGLVDQTDCTSLTRTAVTLTINMAADAPISTGDITECEEDPIQTLDANDAITPTTGQSIVWYDAPTGGNVVANPILNTVGTITYYAEGVVDQTDCTSLTRTAVTLTINMAADAPISTGDITECEEDPIQTLDANDAITPTTGQSIVWYDAPAGGNVVANPILNTVGTITYYAEGVVDQTDCTSLTRTAVTLTINEAADAPISTGDITECEEDPIQTLDANDAITPTTGQSVVWYDAPTGGNVVANPILNTVGTITYYAEGVVDQTDCTSLTRTAVTLTINMAADAPISTGDITECEEDPIQTLDANDAITPTTGQSIVWYDAPTGGNVVANPILNTVGTITYYAEGVVDQTDCVSLTRTAVTLTINQAADAPISTGDITECADDPIQTLDANDAITPTTGQSIVWYDAPTGGNVVANPILNAIGTVTYYAEGVVDQTDCISFTRTAVTLTINTRPKAPINEGDITECADDPIQTLDANDAIIPIGGITIVWYDALTGGNVVANPILDTLGTITYYAEAEFDQTNCTSLNRTAVTLTLNSCSIAIVKEGVFNGTGDCATSEDTITYTFSVYNLGDAPVSNIQITDPLFEAPNPVVSIDYVSGDINNDDLLDTDEIWIYTAIYSVTQTDIDNGEVINQATVQGEVNGTTVTDISGSTVNSDDPTITKLCENPSIALIKVGTVMDENGNGCSDPGETIVYSFEVVNTGNISLTNVTVSDELIDVNGGPIDLDPGESDSTSFTGVYIVTQDDVDLGFVANQALAEGFTPDGALVSDFSDDNSLLEDDPTITDLCQIASLSVEKAGVWNDENNDLSAQPGETISYTFAVTNTGNVTLYNITITDPIPGVMIEGGPIAELAVGETDSTTFTATYVITQEDIDAGEFVNQATATGEDINGVIVEDTSDDPNDPTNIDPDNDGEPDDPTVVNLPTVGPMVDFEIFNGVTPDGDGLNDIFHIVGIENFPDNNLKIFNRWGVLVYDVEGYGQNNQFFRGFSEGRTTIAKNEMLPTGTYYYILVRIDPESGESLNNNGYLYLNN